MSESHFVPAEGECVGCRCVTDDQIGLGDPKDPMTVWCCRECYEDGSLHNWLVKELEEWAESNPNMEKLPDGSWREKEKS